MDFSTLKDMNVTKAWLKGVGSDIVTAIKSVKSANGEKFKNGFKEYFVDYLKENYAKFDGRISRRQYWMFALYSIIIGFVLCILVGIFPFLEILSLIYSLALLVPSVGLLIRRLHDIDLSGWWFLIAVIPLIGALVLLLLLCTPSDKEANRFDNAKK